MAVRAATDSSMYSYIMSTTSLHSTELPEDITNLYLASLLKHCSISEPPALSPVKPFCHAQRTHEPEVQVRSHMSRTWQRIAEIIELLLWREAHIFGGAHVALCSFQCDFWQDLQQYHTCMQREQRLFAGFAHTAQTRDSSITERPQAYF